EGMIADGTSASSPFTVTVSATDGTYSADPVAFQWNVIVLPSYTLTPVPDTDHQSAYAGSFFPHPLQARLTDRDGHPVPGVVVEFVVPVFQIVTTHYVPPTYGGYFVYPGGGSGFVSFAVTDASGVATADPLVPANNLSPFGFGGTAGFAVGASAIIDGNVVAKTGFQGTHPGFPLQ